MIPTKTTMRVDSNLQGEDVEMEIDRSALTHIMGVLTDLYADPELAVIREYSTNAYDSHIEAGYPGPIEVTLPSKLRPVLSIRDYGIGMDAEDIRNIYSRYGISTKRNSNDAVGMLGLGCKSALAYADQFTLVGIKNGVRTMVSVSRNEEGTGTMTILDQAETDEANGVEVQIPVRPNNQMEQKASDFFRFWEPGTVKVNGEEPTPISGYALSDSMTVIQSGNSRRYYAYGYSNKNCYVVMGNVAYEANIESLPMVNGRKLVVRVPIGAVQFAPSREDLQMTPKTKAVLEQIAQTYKTDRDKALTRHLKGAKTRSEAIRCATEAADALGLEVKGKWRGEELPAEIKPNAGALFVAPSAGRSGTRTKLASEHANVALKTALNATWVLGFANGNFTRPQHDKLNSYLEHQGIDPAENFITTADSKLPYVNWLKDTVESVNWEDVKKWRDPSKPKATYGGGGGSGVRTACYDTYVGGGRSHYLNKNYSSANYDLSKPLFFYEGSADYYGESGKRSTRELAFALVPDCVIVRVPSTRVAKFKRDFPKAQEINDGIKTAFESWYDGLEKDDLVALATFADGTIRMDSSYRHLPFDKLDDPDLKRLVELHNRYVALNCGLWKDRVVSHKAEREFTAKSAEKLLDRYPLLGHLSRNLYSLDEVELDHLVKYMNSVYPGIDEDGEQGS